MQPHQPLFESLFKKDFSDPGNKQLLEEITAAHPYFSPAQFFLLKQTNEGTADYEKQAGITNIFFNNPLWLKFQLGQKQEEFMAEDALSTPVEIPAVVEDTLKEEEPFTEHVMVPETTAEPVEIKEKLVVIEEISIPEMTPETGSIIETAEKITEQFEEPGGSAGTEMIQEEQTFIIENVHVAETIVQEETKEDEPATVPAAETEIMKPESKTPEEKNIPEELPLFEPMHMVDYFASQGIKLSEEVQTADKLGKQLKSFTEWLKTMKKIHTGNQPQDGVQTDQTVEALAEMSNQQNEVITEAMAEVFARQGKAAKAIEVYQKLSLLNPAKSAYFAAKIENLKGA